MSRRPVGRPQSDDAVARRATRHAAGTDQIDDRLLHTDPEAAARHIRALRRQQQEQASQQLGSQQAEHPPPAEEQQQQEQQPGGSPQQQPPAAAPAEDGLLDGVAPADDEAAGAAGVQDRDVLVESMKENLPEAAATATPLADPAAAAAATAAKAAKGTLTAVVQQHGSSRLRWEGAAQQQQQQQQQQAAAEAEPEAEERPQEGAAAEAEQQRAVPEAPPAFQPSPEDYARADRLRGALVQQTEGLVLDNLESIHAKLSRWGQWQGGYE